MKILDFQQGSTEWLQARAGKVTASRISDVLAKIKTGEAASRSDYRAQIVAEILIGKPLEDGFTNSAMEWGSEQEPFARAAYECKTGMLVDQVGLVIHPTIERAAASPDGLVDFDGLVEIKCPKTATHIDYLMSGVAPSKYHNQMLWQMACTGRDWCQFVSFDPRMPEHLQLFIAPRFNRDEERIKAMETEVKDFLSKCETMVAKLQEVKP